MEACSAAHHWGRVLTGLGHDVKLIAPEAVKPFAKKGKKNDAADVAAVCLAAGQPDVKFVPIKILGQQGVLALHSARSCRSSSSHSASVSFDFLASRFDLFCPDEPFNEVAFRCDRAFDVSPSHHRNPHCRTWHPRRPPRIEPGANIRLIGRRVGHPSPTARRLVRVCDPQSSC
jgi:hypothetical protein